jgi:hypothetical protein
MFPPAAPNQLNPDEWKPIFALPNIVLDQAIETREAVLAPMDDIRVTRLANARQPFQEYLSRFTDAFGQRLAPCVLLVRRDAPQRFFVVDTLASFRDVIALSVILYGRAHTLLYPHQHRTRFSNSFTLYPWMLDRNYEHLIMSSPGHMGIHDVNAFAGQSSPEVFISRLRYQTDFDETLLSALLNRWRLRYQVGNPEWCDVTLFRSLNMAHEASQMPGTVVYTYFDFGRSLALWVSAFEILAHPGAGGRSGLNPVYQQLQRVPWVIARSGHKRYAAYSNRGPRERRSLACWLYGIAYQRRNDYLHGNPADERQLTFPVRTAAGVRKRFIFDFIAPLYRLALTSFLNLKCNVTLPPIDDAAAFAAAATEIWCFNGFQRVYEEATNSCRLPPEEDD